MTKPDAGTGIELRGQSWRSRHQWLFLLSAGAIVVGGALADWTFLRLGGASYGAGPHEPLPLTFDGDSGLLRETVVVPTLDTPVEAGKNVVWCASFEFAWKRLSADVVKEPVRVTGAEAVAERLNAAVCAESDVLPDDCYAAAGLASDGSAARIREEMAKRFPGVPAPEFDGSAAAIAYAYLRASVTFTIPFFENDAEFKFTDSAGQAVSVASFGIRPRDVWKTEDMRGQVEILCAEGAGPRRKDAKGGGMEYAAFVLDPCRTSTPYQIVLAVIPRRETLAATLADLDSKIAARSRPLEKFHELDVLLIPGLSWRIKHHFAELEGANRYLKNAGFEKLWIQTALQMIEFSLDRGGAHLESEAKIECKSIPTYYVFDRPFLIYLKKRGAERPFFAMWVENAELLARPRGE